MVRDFFQSLRGQGRSRVAPPVQRTGGFGALLQRVRRLFASSEPGRGLVAIPGKSIDIYRKLPQPVQLSLEHASKRSLGFTVEIFAGLLVVTTVLFVLAYGRLSQGPVSFAFVVPILEEAINRELVDVTVEIDDAVVQRTDTGAGVRFRLRNVRLIDKSGAVVAQAPLAAIGLSGRALFSGTIAPGSVDFIGPRLLLFYTADGGLSLTFADGRTEPTVLRGSVPPDGSGKANPDSNAVIAKNEEQHEVSLFARSRQIDITKTITSAFESARRRETASSYLSRFGVQDAVVVFEQGGDQSYWQVPDFSIDLEHGDESSVLLGEANIDAKSGPWNLQFKTEQSERQKSLTFTALVQDLVPNGLAEQFPNVEALKSLDMPIKGETSVELSSDGKIKGAEAKIKLAAGHIVVPWDLEHPMLIDEGDFHIRYQAEGERVELLPSVIQWGASKATVEGLFEPIASVGGAKTWGFRLQARDAVLAVEEFGLAPMRVDEWHAIGSVTPETGDMKLDRFVIKAGGASVELAGTVKDGEGSPAVKLSGRLSPMSIAIVKQFWPKFLASGAREWVGERVPEGQVTGGSLNINMPAGMIAGIVKGGDIPDDAMRLEMEMKALKIEYLPGMPALLSDHGRLRITGRAFKFDAPTARVVLPSGRQVAFANGRFAIDDLRPDPQQGKITFDTIGSAESMLELMDQPRLRYAQEVGIKPSDVNGKATGRVTIGMPLLRDLEFHHLTLNGEVQLTEAAANGVVEKVSLEKGTIDFSFNEKALDARGDVLVNGVPALMTWQRIFAAPEHQQPDIRVSAVLDDKSRDELGLDMKHIVRGPVPVIVSVGHRLEGGKKISVQADLANADIILAHMGWRKRPGHRAVLKFDIGHDEKDLPRLKNFNVKGEDIAIQGWIALGADNRPTAFSFPDLSFNIVTHVSVNGQLTDDNVWKVKATGARYDGRQFFESLFSAGELAEDQPALPEKGPGLELTARIGTMLGFFDTTVRDVKIDLKKRKGALQALTASGKLNGTAALAVRLQKEDGQGRVVLAESEDAGGAFRLVGFYPRIEGGQASIRIDMDRTGAGTKTGTLWARNFNILGDKVVSEVISKSKDDSVPGFSATDRARDPKRQNPDGRTRVYFDQLRVPFEVGGGRFVVHRSYINGPRLGATLRGGVDFASQEINLHGTYVPLYGLNSALGSIPLIGNLFVGRRGEGLLGITFAIQGTTERPLVRVNPVSIVAPGIFRQIFEFRGGPGNEQFQQRRQAPQSERARARARQQKEEASTAFPTN